MAANLVALLHPRMVAIASEQPLWIDLTGGWTNVKEFERSISAIRDDLKLRSARASAISQERSAKKDLVTDSAMDQQWVAKLGLSSPNVPLANSKVDFPVLPAYSSLAKLGLEGMVDPERVVCVVGFGEIGPWGNAKTRWEMEAYGHFSLEGCIELAWLVGLVQHHEGPLKNNPRARYVGWVDSTTLEPVLDHEIKQKYEKILLKHSGIRIIEPELFEGYDPNEKKAWSKVGVEHDMPLIEVSSEEHGLEIQLASGGPDKCSVFFDSTSNSWKAKLLAGAVIAIPRAFQFNRFVAGQIPTGWNAKRLGIPDEIADSVDPVTLYALVSTMDAFISAGVCDPYELYQYVHVSSVGNTSGGGMGGMRSLKRIFHERNMDESIQSDTLAESFINSMPAWVNMLLLSSSGPIKTPVGACATGAESVDIGVETILSGKARVVVCGGYDDFGEVGSYEFGQLGATQNNAADRECGRRPDESSRPMSSSRSGFVESQGAGMQVLMDAKLAIEMGCPIYGIVALTNTATDREGRSIPAPGRGILTTARQVGKKPHKALDVQVRKKNIALELKLLDEWTSTEMDRLEASDEKDSEFIHSIAAKKKSGIYETWGQGFYRNLSCSVSPLTGALAVWGLDIDSIGVVSCHGTSTLLNDKNESSVINLQMDHLGRTPGNIVCVVAQKWLTAHPKGAAASWMVNGALQILNSGICPGNRNLDNCADELREFPFLFYPNRSMRLSKVESVLLKSFGFGQAGAEILLVNPNRLLATLTREEFEAYEDKCASRSKSTYRYMQRVLTSKHPLVQVKTRAPYLPEQETEVYLNPEARATYSNQLKTWTFPVTSDTVSAPVKGSESVLTKRQGKPKSAETKLKLTLQEQAEGIFASSNGTVGVGVDIENVSTFLDWQARKIFISKNFRPREIEYCSQASNPAMSFAGRWAAKESVVKALSNYNPDAKHLWSGASGSLESIEISSSSSGAPIVTLHGHSKQVAEALGVSEIKLSISHTLDVAIAQSLAQ